MAVKNNSPEYWRNRMLLLEKAQLQKTERFIKDVERQYAYAARNIEDQIIVWYARFAQNNQIDMATARQWLNTKELAEFKWDVKQYIKYGQENALDQRWMTELENASARVHISRLEALKLQMQQRVEALYGNQLDGVDNHLRRIYSDEYFHTAYEIQRGFNLGWDLHDIDSNRLTKILSRPWAADGKTFSSRIWTNKQQLYNTLQTQLSQAVITGKSPTDAIQVLVDQFGVDKRKAGRLIMTETAAFASAAQKDCYSNLSVERFEIVATLDTHTSEICQELDGQVFDMQDYEVGVTAPPFHCWCRTVTVPYFADNYGERAARDAEGNTYYVPSDMKYEDWAKSFVGGGSKAGLSQNVFQMNDPAINNFKSTFGQWNGQNIQDFAAAIVKQENLPVVVQRHNLNGANGVCRMNATNATMETLSYELNSADTRSTEYQIKTAFHELFHAKAHGLTHDARQISFKDWAYVDDIFAETSSHYLVKSMGINHEIAPSYAGHLVNSLPKLKTLPEFGSCATIADFGEVALKFRFSPNATAEWKSILDVLNNTKFDIIDYSKNYIQYISDYRHELVDKFLETNPRQASYRPYMVMDIENAVKAINAGQALNNNETIMFNNALIIAMNRLGVKPI